MLFILSILFFCAIVLHIACKKTSLNVIKPDFWLIVFFLFLFITHLTFGVTYDAGNVLYAIPFVCVSLMLVLYGNKLGRRNKTKRVVVYKNVNVRRLALISIISSVVLVYDILRNNGMFSLGTRLDDFKISSIGTIANILSGLGLVAWLFFLQSYVVNGGKLPLLSVGALSSFVVYDIVTGGRQTIAISFFSSLAILLWSVKFRKEKGIHSKLRFPFPIVAVVCVFLGYLIVVSSVRRVFSSPEHRIEYMESFFAADLNDETESLIIKSGAFGDIFSEFGLYYSHELYRLSLLLEYYHDSPAFFPLEMSYITRRFPKLQAKADSSWATQEYILEHRVHFSAHTWSTFLGNFLMDFGILGTFFVCLICGYVMGAIWKAYQDRRSVFLLIRVCVLIGGLFVSIEFNPLSQISWFSCLLFLTFFENDSNKR